MKSYKEFINESWEIHSDVLDKLIDPIRDDIADMLVDLVGYDINFIPANMFFESSMGFKLLIKRKGYYNDGSGPMPGNEDIDPVVIDEDILDEFGRLIHFIESEIGFYYNNTISYYNYILTEKGFCHRGSDLFSSLVDQQDGKKFIISISMFFGNKIPWTKPKESTKSDTPVKESLDKFNYRLVDLDLREDIKDIFLELKSLDKFNYRLVDLDLREDIKDIFLELKDDGYDIVFRWIPRFSGDNLSSDNYPFLMVSKQGLRNSINLSYQRFDDFRFSSEILEEYMVRLGNMLGSEWKVYFEWAGNDGKYYLGKSGEVYNSVVYRIFMVRK
jgi:uncharacterized protein (UPF0335 family)